jgi:hypothetical protein
MARHDINQNLIHFTSGATYSDAFDRLRKIINDQTLFGSNDMIRGGSNCICFSEAPLKSLPFGLVNTDNYSKYSPFGIMFAKSWIFSQGGRPVIYEPDNEFDKLPDSHRWRHVRYEPNSATPIDFTWEREWRIQSDALAFDSFVASVVVPDISWAEALVDNHEENVEFESFAYSQIFDENFARTMFECPFKWKLLTLK